MACRFSLAFFFIVFFPLFACPSPTNTAMTVELVVRWKPPPRRFDESEDRAKENSQTGSPLGAFSVFVLGLSLARSLAALYDYGNFQIQVRHCITFFSLLIMI
jgi:hypothetical protein